MHRVLKYKTTSVKNNYRYLAEKTWQELFVSQLVFIKNNFQGIVQIMFCNWLKIKANDCC